MLFRLLGGRGGVGQEEGEEEEVVQGEDGVEEE